MGISVDGAYPDELVARVAELYGTPLSMKETASRAGIGMPTLQRLMAAHQIRARGPGQRIKPLTCDRNGNWAGDQIGYGGAHLRVRRVMGSADYCMFGCSARRYVWANLTGQYHDPGDYAAMCGSCHWRYDVARKSMEAGFQTTQGWPKRIRHASEGRVVHRRRHRGG